MKRNEAYTLVELVVAMGLAGAVLAASSTVFMHASKMTRAGGAQARFNEMARIASQRATRYIEEGKVISATPTALTIVTTDYKSSRIEFQTGDGDVNTVADNTLVYDPDTGVSGDVEVLCSYVSPIGTNAIFSIVPLSPSAAKLCFHVGDGTDVSDAFFTGTGGGYQGVEVRVSATPRNLQRWYEPD